MPAGGRLHHLPNPHVQGLQHSTFKIGRGSNDALQANTVPPKRLQDALQTRTPTGLHLADPSTLPGNRRKGQQVTSRTGKCSGAKHKDMAIAEFGTGQRSTLMFNRQLSANQSANLPKHPIRN